MQLSLLPLGTPCMETLDLPGKETLSQRRRSGSAHCSNLLASLPDPQSFPEGIVPKWFFQQLGAMLVEWWQSA